MTISKNEFSKGGLVLFACFVGVGVGFSSLNYYTAGIFLTAYESEFGWSRSLISAQGIIGVVALVLLSPVIGTLVDKVGTRLVASISLLMYGLCFIAISRLLDSVVSFLALSLVTAIAAAGSTPVTFTRTVALWFDLSRGIALGLALVGTGVTAVIAPLYLTELIVQEGWREGAQALGIVVLAGATIVALFLRDNPDSFQRSRDLTSSEHPSLETDNTQGHVKSRVYWLLAVVFFLVALAVSGLIVHFIPMLVDTGLTLKEAGKYAATIGVAVIIGRISIGLLIDRFFAPRIACIVFLLAALALVTFAAQGQNMAFFAALAIGITMGAEVDLISFLTSRYFRLENYGRVYGGLYSIFIIGAAVSPVLMGVLFDVYGTYFAALIISIIALLVSAVAFLFLPNYPGANR